MNKTMRRIAVAVAGVGLLASCATAPSGPANMTFFVTSVGAGKGADFGGLSGADGHCQSLANAVGARARTWRAYLSTQAPALNSPDFVNAKDRIGAGPWRNAKGVVIAQSVADLHSPSSNLNKDTAIDEKGGMVKGRVDQPSQHDILTGSRPDGTAFAGAPFQDMTCGNWTKSGTEGSAMTGHFDLAGPVDNAWAKSWNSSHPTRGCDVPGLQSTGGAGFLYCFATN
jgi:hypothetical protein